MNRAVVALIAANIIWGGASAVFKLALENIPPFTLAFIRFFFASLIFLPFMVSRWRTVTFREWMAIVASAFFGIAVHIGFFFLGLKNAPSINAPIILSSAPVFLFVGSLFFLKEKFHLKMLVGMGIAFAGILLIVLYPLFTQSSLSSGIQIEGNLFFVISAISGMVIKPLLNKPIMRRISPVQLTFLEFVIGALFFSPFMLKETAAWSPIMLDSRGMLGIIYGVFFSSAAAYFLFNWGIAKIDAQEVGIFYYIDPIVGLLLGMLLLSEYPTIYYGVGALLVFIGIFIAERRLHYHPIHKVRRG